MSNIESPPHYQHLPGVECIDVAENFNYNMGNAIKYIWRADFKGNPFDDLSKARWYIDREIKRREREYVKSLNTEAENLI